VVNGNKEEKRRLWFVGTMGTKKFLLLVGISAPIAIVAVYVILWYQQLPLRTAEFYRKSGDVGAAIAQVDQYLLAYPENVQALSLKAQLFCDAGRFREATAIYDRIGPATAEDMLAFAKALAAQQRWNSAATTAATYETMYGANADNYLWGVISLTNMGKLDEAIAMSKRLAELEGRESQGLLLYGELKARQSANEDAVQAYSKALELNPTAANLHIPAEAVFESFADLLFGLGRSQETLDIADRGLAIAETARLHHLRGLALLNLGRPGEAREAWLAANKSAPYIPSLIEMSRQYLDEGDPNKALAVMRHLQNLDQIDSRIAYMMQQISEALGKTAEAEKWKTIADDLRDDEAVEGAMLQVINNQPYNSWSVVFRAYFSSKEQRWQEAGDMLRVVEKDFLEEEAYAVLRDAIVAQKIGPGVLEAFSKKISISQ
jgi:tetratricopeptide (TPR) repeat protein